MDRRAREIAQAAALLLQQSGVVGEGDYEVALPMLVNWAHAVDEAAKALFQTDGSQPAAQAMARSLAESLAYLDQLVYYIAQHGAAAIFAAFDGSDPQALTAARRNGTKLRIYAITSGHNSVGQYILSAPISICPDSRCI